MAGFERRRTFRMQLATHVRSTLGPEAEVHVLNLSAGGAMVLHSKPLPLGEIFTLAVHLKATHLRLPARIVWTRPHRQQLNPYEWPVILHRTGLQFIDAGRSAEADVLRSFAGLAWPA